MLLHEASHGYAFRTKPETADKIKNTYDEVMKTGIYDSVEYIFGQMLPAYALTNDSEYFAELSEAFFSGIYDGTEYRNDYYAFYLDQLKTFDPAGYQMCIDVWQINL